MLDGSHPSVYQTNYVSITFQNYDSEMSFIKSNELQRTNVEGLLAELEYDSCKYYLRISLLYIRREQVPFHTACSDMFL